MITASKDYAVHLDFTMTLIPPEGPCKEMTIGINASNTSSKWSKFEVSRYDRALRKYEALRRDGGALRTFRVVGQDYRNPGEILAAGTYDPAHDAVDRAWSDLIIQAWFEKSFGGLEVEIEPIVAHAGCVGN